MAAWLLAGLLALPAPLRAATPRDELLRLVPDSVGFCLIVQDLRGHAAAWQSSPLLEQLRRSPLAIKIHQSDDLKKLDRLEARMKDKLGLDWARLRDDLLGDALVLVYRPGPPDKPEQEQGLFLVRARNTRVLTELIERLNKVQKEDGGLRELEERRHNGIAYYRRVERGRPPSFYYVNGPIVAVSEQEEILRECMDCDRLRATDAIPEVARRLHELGADRALLAMWLNPRAFDADVESKVESAPGDRVATVKHFARYWKALESVVLSLTPSERDINLSLGIRARAEKLPPPARRLFHEASASADVWRRFPEQALFAMGGRIDGVALFDVLGGFLSAENRQSLQSGLNRQVGALLGEEDFARDVLPLLGPDWGFCVLAPAAGDKSWLPQSLFVLRIEAARARKFLDHKLMGMLDFAARLVIFGHNNQHPDKTMTLKTTDVDQQEVHYLASERGLPAGLQPAYGMVSGYLALASSLDGLRRFAQIPAGPAPSPGAPVPLLRISVKDWRAYLNDRREPIVRFLAETNKLESVAAERQLDDLLGGLKFVDRIELRQRTAPGQVVFTLAVQTAQPLKK
jgi:hypothetical protein